MGEVEVDLHRWRLRTFTIKAVSGNAICSSDSAYCSTISGTRDVNALIGSQEWGHRHR